MATITTKFVKKLTVCVDSDISHSYLNGLGKIVKILDDVWEEKKTDSTEVKDTTKKQAQKYVLAFGGDISLKASVTVSDDSTSSTYEEEYTATLTAVRYDKKMFAPGEVRLEFRASRVSASGKNQPSIAFSNLAKNVFLGGTFLVDVFGVKSGYEAVEVSDVSQTVSIASNYYVHSIEVQNTSVKTSSVILKCYSFDKRLMAVRFSRVHTGVHFTTLCGDMVETLLANFKKDLVTVSGGETDVRLFEYPEYALNALTGKWNWRGDTRLFMLAYSSNDENGKNGKRTSNNTAELIHPYLVQYNESFYDFMVRVAHRCGEFLYFENGKLNLGLPSKTWNIVSGRTKNDAKNQSREDKYGDYYLEPLSTVPLCSYPEISSGDCCETLDVKNFHQDYATGASVRDVSLSGFYYDIQNTSDEDLHYISEADNDRDRKSPRWTWILFNMLSTVFINENPLYAMGIAVAYLVFDITCQDVIIPNLTSDEFRSRYLNNGDGDTKVPMVDEKGRETGEYAVRRVEGSETEYLRIKSDGTETHIITDGTECDENWYNTEANKSKTADKNTSTVKTTIVPMVDENNEKTGEYAVKKVEGSETEYRCIKSDGTETDTYTESFDCDATWYESEVKKSTGMGRAESSTTRVPLVDANGKETGEYAVMRDEGFGTEYLLIKSDGTETDKYKDTFDCDEAWYNSEVAKSKGHNKTESTVAKIPLLNEKGRETGEYAVKRVKDKKTEYLRTESDGTESDTAFVTNKCDGDWYEAEAGKSKTAGKTESTVTTTKIPLVDKEKKETGEYAVKMVEGEKIEYLRIKSSGRKTNMTTDDAFSCDADWFYEELRKSEAAGVYNGRQKEYDTARISSNVGIAVSADQKEATGVDDTVNLCNSFFHFIETREEEEERRGVTMDFSSNLADISLGQLARIDDGIEDIYVVTRMYGSYVSKSNTVTISNYAEGVPVLGDEFEGMKNTVAPARGDITHSRQVSPMEAIVVKNEDPLRLGRVKVRYPWQSESDVNTSPWIRITVPFSGTPEFGGFTMTPEVGEHVMLSYVAGNIERPYVEGSLYYRERVKKGDKTEWLVNSPLIGGAEASKVSYRQIARTDYYSTSYKVRSILSGSGHGLIMSDLSDCNFFTSSVPLLKTLWTLGNVASGNGHLQDAGGIGTIKGGGVTLTDGSYMCTVDLLPDKRAINITSSFGTVSIDAFTGISINAPNGDISIKGKNISIEAGNNIQIISGKNILANKRLNQVAMAAGLLVGDYASHLGMAGARIGGVDMTDICDLSFLRAVLEMVLSPVEGTLTIKSNRNVIMTAGKGEVTVPVDMLSKEKTYRVPFKPSTKTNIKNWGWFEPPKSNQFDKREDEKRIDITKIVSNLNLLFGVINSFASNWVACYNSLCEHLNLFVHFFNIEINNNDVFSEKANHICGSIVNLYNSLIDSVDPDEISTQFFVENEYAFMSREEFYKEEFYRPDIKDNDDHLYSSCKTLYGEIGKIIFQMKKVTAAEKMRNDFKTTLVISAVSGINVEIRETAIKAFLGDFIFSPPLLDITYHDLVDGNGAMRQQDYINLGIENFEKYAKKRLAAAYIWALLATQKVTLCPEKVGGKYDKTKEADNIPDSFGTLLGNLETDGSRLVDLADRLMMKEEVKKDWRTSAGMGVASALASAMKVGRYDDNGKFRWSLLQLTNNDGQVGPRTFYKGDAVAGNVFISREASYHYSPSGDDGKWEKKGNNNWEALRGFINNNENQDAMGIVAQPGNNNHVNN